MPRSPDIGWQHGTMVGGLRNHVKCNYCHRKMIGGITRFKKHLANKRGEIKGCEAVPTEVREMIRKHLALSRPQKRAEKKHRKSAARAFVAQRSASETMGLDEGESVAEKSLQVIVAPQDVEAPPSKLADQHFMIGTGEFFDAYSDIPSGDGQGLAPPRSTDFGWAHGIMVDGDRQKIKCRYCTKIILGGGISRLKQHLAGERGNIAPCENAPDDVKVQMRQHRGHKILQRLKKQKDSEGAKTSANHHRDDEYEVDIHTAASTEGSSGRRREKNVCAEPSNRRRRMEKLVVQKASSIQQSTLHRYDASQDSIDRADIAVAKFIYDAGIPFSAANSLYFQQLADAISAVGPGYKMPSFHSLRGLLLKRCVQEVGDTCKELRKSWEGTGCTVMVDRWTDKANCPIINVSVYSPKGTMFLKSVDASNFESAPESLLELFDGVVQEIGPKSVVNFLTGSEPCYKAAGKMLTSMYKTFFWNVCASQCIEVVLMKLGNIDEVKELMGKAKRICQLIYNNEWVVNLTRKITEGRDIILSAKSEYLSSFLTLENMVALKEPLHQVFTSIEWVESSFSKHEMGLVVTETIFDPEFWLACTKIMKASRPLVGVLHVAESKERPSMGYLYDAVEKARKEIVLAFDKKESDNMPYLEIIDNVLKELHSPLHTAAYYLNPSIFYSAEFSMSSVIQKGLLDCIETLVPNLIAQDNITRDRVFYEDAVGDFSRPVALRGRDSLSPATWWSLYGSDYPDLQRFAVRILSQACSITTSEHHWAMYEGTHLENGNRLERERLNDLKYVHYNLHLQERQIAASGGNSLTRDQHDPICMEGRNIFSREWFEDPWIDAAMPSDGLVIENTNNLDIHNNNLHHLEHLQDDESEKVNCSLDS